MRPADSNAFWRTKNLYVGREGAFLIIGADRKQVAAALNAGAKREGLISEEKTATVLKGVEDSAAVAVFASAKGIVELFKQMERSPTVMAAPPFAKVAPPIVAPLPPPGPKPADEAPPKLSLRAEKTIADAAKAVESLPPAVVSISHKADGLTLELRQSGLKHTTSRLIDLWIDASDGAAVRATYSGPLIAFLKRAMRSGAHVVSSRSVARRGEPNSPNAIHPA